MEHAPDTASQGPDTDSPLAGFIQKDFYLKKRARSGLGITVVASAGTTERLFMIRRIMSAGIAAKDGRLLPGDRLVTINGKDLAGHTHAAVLQMITDAPKDCHLTIWRDPEYDGAAFLSSRLSGSHGSLASEGEERQLSYENSPVAIKRRLSQGNSPARSPLVAHLSRSRAGGLTPPRTDSPLTIHRWSTGNATSSGFVSTESPAEPPVFDNEELRPPDVPPSTPPMLADLDGPPDVPPSTPPMLADLDGPPDVPPSTPPTLADLDGPPDVPPSTPPTLADLDGPPDVPPSTPPTLADLDGPPDVPPSTPPTLADLDGPPDVPPSTPPMLADLDGPPDVPPSTPPTLADLDGPPDVPPSTPPTLADLDGLPHVPPSTQPTLSGLEAVLSQHVVTAARKMSVSISSDEDESPPNLPTTPPPQTQEDNMKPLVERPKSIGPVPKGQRLQEVPFEITIVKGLFGLGVSLMLNEMGMIEVKSLTSRSPITKDGNIK